MACDFSRVEQQTVNPEPGWWWVWVTVPKFCSCHSSCCGRVFPVTHPRLLVSGLQMYIMKLCVSIGFTHSYSSLHVGRKLGLPPWSLTHRAGPQPIWQEGSGKLAPKPAVSFSLARDRSLQLTCIKCPAVTSRGHVPTWSGPWGPKVLTLTVEADGFLESFQTMEMGESKGLSCNLWPQSGLPASFCASLKQAMSLFATEH